MNISPTISLNANLSRSQQLRIAVIAAFCANAERIKGELGSHQERDWQRNYPWLDSSGLALYLLDWLRTLGCEDVLPPSVRARFEQNLAENRARTEALFAESVEINRCFEKRGLLFANLKGITLCPDSVPDPALRCQMDLDFLVLAEQATAARQVLEGMGFLLYVVNGDTWEFRAGTSTVASRKDLYRPKPQRTVDLHLSRAPDEHLRRAHIRNFHGEPMRVLSPVDLFLGQALHLFHHVSGAFTRAGWALEFRQHVITRYDDNAFWEAVRNLGLQERKNAAAVGVAVLLTSELFGDFAPAALCKWTVDCVPPSVRLWTQFYSRPVILANFPGTKLYLLLEKELGSKKREERKAIRRQYVPLHMPPMISHGHSGEPILSRMNRYLAQWKFVLFRLRFHVVENLRYTAEAFRWRRSRGLLT